MSPVKRLFKAAGASLLVLVGPRRIECGLVRGKGMQWQHDTLSSVDIGVTDGMDLPLAALASAFQRLPAMPAGTAMRVLVADSWLAAVTVPWSPALQQPDGIDRAARARLTAAGCRSEAGDTLRVIQAPYGAPRLAINYPAPLIAALSQAAARLDVRLESVLSLSAAGWALARRGDAGAATLALVDDGLLVLARGGGRRGARLEELTVRSGSTAEAPSAGLYAFWRRLCLRDPQLAAVDQVPLLDLAAGQGATVTAKPFVALDVAGGGDAPVSAGLRLAALGRGDRDPLDAVRGSPPWSMLRLATVAGALLVAVVTVTQAVRTSQAVHDLQASIDRAVPPPRVVARAAPWSAEEVARVQAVNVAVRELNLPFSAILRALAPPPDLRVAVLSVATSASRSSTQPSSVKIVAEARTSGEMARYVAFLAERKPFTGAYLVEHEIDETSAERPYRFTLEAAWKD